MQGTWQHLPHDDKLEFQLDWLSDEALETSAIEGEILQRASVQSSVRQQFGLSPTVPKSGPRDTGVAELLSLVFKTYDQPLTKAMLSQWHSAVMRGRTDMKVVGDWRQHTDPMQVVSGLDYDQIVHFEAPPSERMEQKMARLIDWFETETRLPAIARGVWDICTLFGCIHLRMAMGGSPVLYLRKLWRKRKGPSLTALSQVIMQRRNGYYDTLAAANRSLDVTAWLQWYGEAILDGQTRSEHKLIRLIEKTQMLDKLRGQLNPRQEKIILRLFDAEPEGFEGGLSASNARQITQASDATATRDLTDLVTKGVLRREGERRYARYYLQVSDLS